MGKIRASSTAVIPHEYRPLAGTFFGVIIANLAVFAGALLHTNYLQQPLDYSGNLPAAIAFAATATENPIVGSWAQTKDASGTGDYIWDTEISKDKVPDWDRYFELVNDRSGVKVKVAGFYHVSYNIRLAPAADGQVVTLGRINGVNQLSDHHSELRPELTAISHASRPIWIDANQVVTVNLYTGAKRLGNRIQGTTGSTTNLSIYRLSK